VHRGRFTAVAEALLAAFGLSCAAPAAARVGGSRGPAPVAVAVARALARGDVAPVCENLTPYFKRFLSDFLLRAVPPNFIPPLPPGASLQQRCVAALTGDLADPAGDGLGWRGFRGTRSRYVVYTRDRRHATVCLGHSIAAVAPATQIHGRWLLSDLPSDGLTQRQARICRLG